MPTQASNPTNLSVNKLQWIKFHPVWSLTWLIGLFISGYLTYTFRGYNIIHTIFFVFANWLYWWIQERIISKGDFNYGRVVAINPTLIAVPTDLRKGMGRFPVIKIAKTKLKKIEGKALEVGDKIVTVSMYSDHSKGDYPFWEDVEPRPVYVGYTNVAVLNERMKQFTDEDWKYLDTELSKISKPYSEGLYRVNPTENGWKDYPNN
jgi:hypothetical protein